MSAHTPGPWEVDPSPEYDDIGNPQDPEFASHVRAAGESVCGTCDGCNRIKMADARLIAAAPDLLAALKVARGYVQPQRVLKRIVAAIAKAEGNS